MVYVQTIKQGVSCTIQGDRIERKEDNYIVTIGENITGVFDVGSIEFMYLTKQKEKPESTNI